MDYNRWKYRDGSLWVEKYSGTVRSIDEILNNDDELLTSVPPEVCQLLVLTDVSRATFSGITHKQFAELFRSIDKHATKTNGMRLAVHTGANHYEDFQKVYTYVLSAVNRPLSVFLFNFIDAAMSWLDLSADEKEQIMKHLAWRQ